MQNGALNALLHTHKRDHGEAINTSAYRVRAALRARSPETEARHRGRLDVT